MQKTNGQIDAQSLIDVLQMQRNEAMDKLAQMAAYAKKLEGQVAAMDSLAERKREYPEGERGADAAKQ